MDYLIILGVIALIAVVLIVFYLTKKKGKEKVETPGFSEEEKEINIPEESEQTPVGMESEFKSESEEDEEI